MEFSFLNRGTEEEIVVMDKTVSVGSSVDGEKTVSDNLNPASKSFAVDAEREIVVKKEEPIIIPLYRFKDAYIPRIVVMVTRLVGLANETKSRLIDKYGKMFEIMRVIDPLDVKYLVDLEILRNKNLTVADPKKVRLEVVRCMYDKRIRVKLGLSEDDIPDKETHKEYYSEIEEIRRQFIEFCGELTKSKNPDNADELSTKISVDLKVSVEETVGSENEGAGLALTVEYQKEVDYTVSERVSSESYLSLFKSELTESERARYIKSSEADDEEGGEDTGGGEDDGDGGDEADDSLGGADGMGDFAGMGGEEGEGGEEGGDEEGGEGGDDQGDTGGDSGGADTGGSDDEKKDTGDNPFSDINGRDKVAIETKEIGNQIMRILTIFDNKGETDPKVSTIIQEMVELKQIITDAVKLAYIEPIEKSMVRYSLYVTRFQELSKKLSRTVKESQKDDRKNKK